MANLQMWDLRITRVGYTKTESPSIYPGGSMKSKLKSRDSRGSVGAGGIDLGVVAIYLNLYL